VTCPHCQSTAVCVIVGQPHCNNCGKEFVEPDPDIWAHAPDFEPIRFPTRRQMLDGWKDIRPKKK
jgi:hypothetical protein